MTSPASHGDQPYAANDERPPWLEEAADPTYWDLAFGSYGDGYLEWVASRYFWDSDDLRTTADTRTLWDKRARYAADEVVAHQLAERRRRASLGPRAR
jgi:hypothetical protein